MKNGVKGPINILDNTGTATKGFLMHKAFLFATLAFLTSILCPLAASESTVEVRSAAFFHSSKKFRDIYGNVGPVFQLEGSTKICAPFEAWTNFDWFCKHKKHGSCMKTRVTIANASFGIKYVYCLCDNFDLYAGIGPSFSRITLHNKFCCNKEKVSKFAVGGIVKSGMRYYFCQNLFLDLFVDYLYQPVHFDNRVDIGGIKSGVGLGLRF